MQYKEQKSPRTKVCYAITKGNWGGAQKYVYTLATNLPSNEFDVFVITGAGNILKEKLEEKGVRVYEILNLKRDISVVSEIKSFFQMFRILIKEKPNVLHLNSPKIGGMGSVIGRILFIKNIIYTAHGWTFNEDRKTTSKILIRALSLVTVLLCNKTIVIAEREKRQILEMLPFGKNKIKLIRNGVEKIDFKEKTVARTSLLEKIEMFVSEDTLWFGTIAELHKNKGIEYAIEAVSKIKEPFVYFIIGQGEERNKLEKLIEKHGLREKVFLVGFLEKANEYLKAFDIYLCSSIKEGLPYTLLEAGQAGIPIIASNTGGIPDIIENSKNGILTTKARSGEITRSIEYMIGNPEKTKEFGKNIKEKVDKEFSVEEMLKKTINLYV